MHFPSYLLFALPLLTRASAQRRDLDERGLPITATTTIVVGVTRTETVWVMPTGQAVFAPVPSSTPSLSASDSISTSAVGSTSSSTVLPDPSISPSYATESITNSPTSTISVDAITSALTASGTSADSSLTTSAPSQSVTSVDAADITSALTLSVTSVDADSFTSAVTASITGSSSPSITSSITVSPTLASVTSSSAVSATSSIQPSVTASITESVTNDAFSSTTSFTGSVTDDAVSSTILPLTASTTLSSAPSITESVTEAIASSSSSILPSWTITPSTLWSAPSSTTSLTPLPSSTSTNLPALPATLMDAYYPDWSGWYLSPESVDFTKFDVIDFAFALPTSDFNLEFTQSDSSDLLTRLVKLAHAAGKRVKLSIGGWTGSTYFSTICASAGNRAVFVRNIRKAVDSYGLDGIDIDWEYPGTGGSSGNAVSPNDSANFLLFLTELRAALPVGSLISTATQVWPFADENGRPMSDVSGFAKVIDWILIMNYDVWGSSTTPGANAPLNDGCGNSSQPLANAYAAISSWTTAGMPANQITLGVPAYGYLQKSKATQLKDRRRHNIHNLPHRRHGLLSERAGGVVVYNDNGGNSDGQVMWESLVSQGALAQDGSGNWVGAGGFVREWDSCSSTPWLRSTSSGQIITYDDTQSMSLKGQFAAQAGLRGCNVFSIDGDYTNGGWPLTDAVRSGLGL